MCIRDRNNTDLGDTCVIVNAQNLRLTGKKRFQKEVVYHTGYIGNLKKVPFRKFITEKVEQLVHLSVSKMLPTFRLRDQLRKKLYVFRGPNHTFGHLPTFVPEVIKHDPEDLIADMMDPKKSTVVYEKEEIPEFKDFPRAINQDLLFNQGKLRPPVREALSQETIKEIKRVKRLNRRYKEHKYKPPKVRTMDDRWIFRKDTDLIKWGVVKNRAELEAFNEAPPEEDEIDERGSKKK
eukprot:TRINITY_DN5328_c0_g1_i1.p2 TRINITY_DN5328_c0_g1~~TRINITY_DN5328_c0_g1_i1.p2  ORF type:complete len:256 (+),score=88.12 TRINITY_DN5328_c0_g1_i1:61-768(+)